MSEPSQERKAEILALHRFIIRMTTAAEIAVPNLQIARSVVAIDLAFNSYLADVQAAWRDYRSVVGIEADCTPAKLDPAVTALYSQSRPALLAIESNLNQMLYGKYKG